MFLSETEANRRLALVDWAALENKPNKVKNREFTEIKAQHPDEVFNQTYWTILDSSGGCSRAEYAALDQGFADWLNTEGKAQEIFHGLICADGDARTFALVMGPAGLELLRGFVRAAGLPEHFLVLKTIGEKYTGGVELEDGAPRVKARKAQVRIKHRVSMSFSWMPKTRAALRARDPKNLEKCYDHPLRMLGFHFGDGSVNGLCANHRVSAQYVDSFINRFGGINYRGKKTPQINFSRMETLSFLTMAYESFDDSLPHIDYKVERARRIIQKLTPPTPSPRPSISPGVQPPNNTPL